MDTKQMTLHLPVEVFEHLKDQAKTAGRSTTKEINARLLDSISINASDIDELVLRIQSDLNSVKSIIDTKLSKKDVDPLEVEAIKILRSLTPSQIELWFKMAQTIQGHK